MDIPFEHIADTPPAPEGYSLATSSVSQDGALLFLFIENDATSGIFARTKDAGDVSFPQTRMAQARKAELCCLQDNTEVRTNIAFDMAFPLIDIFPSGEILVTGARANRYSDGTTDKNAVVFGPDGAEMSRFLLGDGIEELAIDGQGRIWVAYSDDGIWGNFGWGWGTPPVGESGLVCFSRDGEKLWEFAATGPYGSSTGIDNIYALNVHQSRVLAYYYPEFLLAEVGADLSVRVRDPRVTFSSAFAASGDQYLFAGAGLKKDAVGGLLCQDIGRPWLPTRPVSFIAPGGQEFGIGQYIGRGPCLYHLTRGGVWAADMRNIPDH